VTTDLGSYSLPKTGCRLLPHPVGRSVASGHRHRTPGSTIALAGGIVLFGDPYPVRERGPNGRHLLIGRPTCCPQATRRREATALTHHRAVRHVRSVTSHTAGRGALFERHI
jgi:hypothetical protein